MASFLVVGEGGDGLASGVSHLNRWTGWSGVIRVSFLALTIVSE